MEDIVSHSYKFCKRTMNEQFRILGKFSKASSTSVGMTIECKLENPTSLLPAGFN